MNKAYGTGALGLEKNKIKIKNNLTYQETFVSLYSI